MDLLPLQRLRGAGRSFARLMPDGEDTKHLKLIGDIEDIAHVFSRLLSSARIASVGICPARSEAKRLCLQLDIARSQRSVSDPALALHR